jgi:hypothetical protein
VALPVKRGLWALATARGDPLLSLIFEGRGSCTASLGTGLWHGVAFIFCLLSSEGRSRDRKIALLDF